MERTCRQAVAIGLPVIAFTEHLDHTRWTPDLAGLDPDHPVAIFSAAEGRVVPPPFDAAG